MSREFAGERFFQRQPVFLLVGVRDGADLAVAAVAEDGADGELVGADAGLAGAVDLADVGVDGGREAGGGIFLAGGGEDHGEEAFGFGGEVAADVRFEAAVVGGLVGVFDGLQVGVGAADEDVVEPVFFGADAGDGAVEEEDVLLEGASEDGEEAEFEVVGCFGFDVGFERAVVALLVGGFQVWDERSRVVA